jgi:hypothetical protein
MSSCKCCKEEETYKVVRISPGIDRGDTKHVVVKTRDGERGVSKAVARKRARARS